MPLIAEDKKRVLTEYAFFGINLDIGILRY